MTTTAPGQLLGALLPECILMFVYPFQVQLSGGQGQAVEGGWKGEGK